MGRVRRRVTFSRNLTLSLSRTCRCYCKYCAFATHQPHLHEPAEVERVLDGAVRRLGNRLGVHVRAVVLDQPEAAVDVDKPSDHALAEAILKARV